MSDWYCKFDGVESGPFQLHELRYLMERGKLAPDDLVREGPGGPWRPLTAFAGLTEAVPPRTGDDVKQRAAGNPVQSMSPSKREPAGRRPDPQKNRNAPPVAVPARPSANRSAGDSRPPPRKRGTFTGARPPTAPQRGMTQGQIRKRILAGVGLGVGVFLLLLVLLLLFIRPGASGGGALGKGGLGAGGGSGNGLGAGSGDGSGAGSGGGAGDDAGGGSYAVELGGGDPGHQESELHNEQAKGEAEPAGDTPNAPPDTNPNTEPQTDVAEEEPLLPGIFSVQEIVEEAPQSTTGSERLGTRTGGGGGGGGGTTGSFSERLEREGAKTGDVQISLIWNNYNDLDLHVFCPSGEEISYNHKRSACLGELDVDMNVQRRHSMEPVENVYWPAGKAPSGEFRVVVDHFRNHGGTDPTSFQVRVKVDRRTRMFGGQISHGDGPLTVYDFTRR